MDIKQVLGILNEEYLCHYERTERMAPPVMQQAVSGETADVQMLLPLESLVDTNEGGND